MVDVDPLQREAGLGQRRLVAPIDLAIRDRNAAIIGDVGVGARATTTNALSNVHRISTADTNAANIKASAGRLYGFTAYNDNAAVRYLKFHNTAGTPTAGAAVVHTFALPPKVVTPFYLEIGKFFATGIDITLVTGLTDADATGVAASEIVLEIWYA